MDTKLDKTPPISRRLFLRLAGMSAATGFLVACGAPAAPAEQAPAASGAARQSRRPKQRSTLNIK